MQHGSSVKFNFKIMACKTTIERVENGYLIIDRYEYEDGSNSVSVTVIEDGDNDNETMARALVSVAESLGYNEDKYGSDNISITFDRKGYKCGEEEEKREGESEETKKIFG